MDKETLEKILKTQRESLEKVIAENRVFMEATLAARAGVTNVWQFRSFDKSVESWSNYLLQMDQHFCACGVKEEYQKRACFLSWCSNGMLVELQKLFGGSDIKEATYKELTVKLTEYYASKVHILGARFTFNRTMMKPNQTYKEWIADLRGVARNCGFSCGVATCKSSFVDFMIRDVVVINAPHDPVRTAALSKANPTLEEVLEIAEVFESTNKTFQLTKGENGNQVNAMGIQGMNNLFINKSCPDCLVKHNRENCVHVKSKCYNCAKRGHIAAVCNSKKRYTRGRSQSRHYNRNRCNRSTSNHSMNRKSGHEGHKVRNNPTTSNAVNNFAFDTVHYDKLHSIDVENNTTSVVDVCTVVSSETDELFKLYIRNNKMFISLLINNKTIQFQFDTGSPCTMVANEGYTILKNPRLSTVNMGLRAYGGYPVTVKGQLDTDVVYKGNRFKLPLIFVDVENGANILGLDWIKALGFRIVNTDIPGQQILQLNTNQQELIKSIEELCKQHHLLFDNVLGAAENFEAKLTLKSGAISKYHKARPLPFALMKPVKEELHRLIGNKIIEPIQTSDWAAPIVPVTKTSGAIRICGDFKALNSQLEIDRHPIPRIDEIFIKLQGGQFFSKIDLSDAYLQIPLEERSQKLVVINTPFGLYKYLRLPFGVASAPGIFQRKMDELISGIPMCVAYLDDVIISGHTAVEHQHNLKQLFIKLEENGIKCKKEKCVFGQPEVEYLGHIIFSSGIRPSDSNTKAIENMPRPVNVKQLEAFIGKANYYHKFIRNFSQIAAPLNALRHRDVDFVWTECQEQAFRKIKDELINQTKLTHFDDKLPIVLAADASQDGIGAVISHIFPDGTEQPIGFASKTLEKHQKAYSQVEKEALGIVFGIKQFHQYLYGRNFILYTDHKCLTTLFNPNKNLPIVTLHRLQRWAIALRAYSYTIKFRPTTQHSNADGLSRLPMGPDQEFDYYELRSGVQEIYDITAQEYPIDSRVIEDHTKRDNVLLRVIGLIQRGWPEKLTETYNHISCEKCH